MSSTSKQNKGGYTIPMGAFPDVGIPLILKSLMDGEEVRINYELGYVTISIYDRSIGEVEGMSDMLNRFSQNGKDE